MDWTVGGISSSGGGKWWPVTCRCETEGEIKDSRSRISPLSIFASCNRLKCGKIGVPGWLGVDGGLTLLSEETRERSTMKGKLIGGSSWREKHDETIEREMSEVAFDLRMSETITVVGSG